LLKDRRPLEGYDWRTDDQAIRQALAWPFEGLLLDIEHGLWWPHLGERPDTAEKRVEVLRAAIAAAPRLIPILGHRYLPAEPNESGNPVLSVHQHDIIYYGRDLTDYFDREFHRTPGPFGSMRRIRFWSDFIEGA
jgi:hypothetical protein